MQVQHAVALDHLVGIAEEHSADELPGERDARLDRSGDGGAPASLISLSA